MEKNILNKKLLNNVLNSSSDEDEYLLKSENNRLTTFPIKNQEIWKSYELQQAMFWTAKEIDFSKDYNDFIKLNQNEQHFIKMVLAFFSSADTIVNINIGERFSKDIKIREAIVCYNWQKMIEDIHCVSGDTKILTENGYYKIEDLLNKNIKVWNGKIFSDTIVKYTGDSELYKITLSNYMTLMCTPKHKWFIRQGNQSHPEQCVKNIVFTENLKINDVIYDYDLPILNNQDPDNFLNPYIHGFFCGNGTYSNNYPLIYLYGEKKLLLKYFEIDKHSINNDRIQFYITKKINKYKYEVPINYSLATKLRWLEGYCDSDGCIANKKTHPSIQLTSINLEFLKNIQLMLNTIGINPEIKLMRDERTSIFTNDDKSKRESFCNKCYVMYINSANYIKLLNLGFEPKRLKVDINYKKTILKSRKKLLKISSIEKINGIHKTYCFNEEKEHSGIFNGILTGQSQTYSLQIENIIKDSEEKERLFKAVENFDCIAEKADWAVKWIESKDCFARRLLAFAIVEGVFFSGSFCAIYWLKKRNLMPGLCASNELISRDEGAHTQFAVLLYSMLQNKLSESDVHAMFMDAVNIEIKFITESLPCSLLGMNSDLMIQYIKYVADRLLVDLGYSKFWNVLNPFDFMESISLEGKTNFFENRPTQYQKASVLNKSRDNIFDFGEDF
jgi:ribonucleotide reductase beta subunit family protein with ferritin-like domain